MEQRTLAGTDLTVGRAILGTMTFGSQVDSDEAAAMVARSRDAGVTMFDTSNNYNDGASEELLGRIIAPFRDEVVLSTKVGSQVRSDPELSGLTTTAIVGEVEGSLRRLRTDRIDVYHFHRPDWTTPLEVSLEAADQLVRAGKVRYVAQSNFAAWQITELLSLAERNDWPEVRISQPMYNLLARRIETEYEAASAHHGLSNIVYNPLAGGLLTGKHRRDTVPDDGTRFSGRQYRDRYWHDTTFDAVHELERIADDAGMTLVELAFRWLLARPLTDGIILGASSVAQLDTNLAAIEGPVPDDETMRRCDDVWATLRGVAPDYNR